MTSSPWMVLSTKFDFFNLDVIPAAHGAPDLQLFFLVATGRRRCLHMLDPALKYIQGPPNLREGEGRRFGLRYLPFFPMI